MSEKRQFGTTSPDTPQADGEHLVSWVRLVLAFIALVLLAGYTLTTARVVWHSLHLSGVAMISWGIMSIVYLFVIRRGAYRPWMSAVSTVIDIAVVTLIQAALIAVLPLNFVNGPITSIYFLVIGLAALRKSRALAVFAGFASAIVHVTVCSIAFHKFVPAFYLMTEINGHPMEITFLDEVGIALCLAFMGWIIGHVTRGLRESERHYQELFENVPDGILIASADRKIRAVNRRFAVLVGLSPDRLIGRSVSDHLGTTSADSTQLRAGFQGLIGGPTVLTTADGNQIPVRTVTTPIDFQGESCVEMSVRDVAEQAQLERQLAQSQKMETIGRLAGGLAHDFNNILGGILGATSLARRSVARLTDEASRESLEKQLGVVLECSERARDVVTRLLTFSRKSVIEAEPLDLGRLASDVATICTNTFGSEISVKIVSPPIPVIVEGDRTSLTQALLNLCINARDSISGAGEITIDLGDVDLQDEEVFRHPSADNDEDYCRISVSDNGHGIDDETLGKIFDPFFTTKPPGEGTGLGLSMVYNIARQHGGFVAVKSSPGRGSTFTIYLTRGRVSLLPPETQGSDLPRGNERIMVVDDDRAVRSTLQGMLSELGYRVKIASNGQQATEIFSSANNQVDLIILDMMMPQVDGAETLRRIRALDKEVKVIITSGFVDVNQTSGLTELGFSDFLSKPFTFQTLARMVRSTLDKN